MDEKKLSERIQEGLVLDLVSEIKALEHRLTEADTFRNYLVALGHLNQEEFYCAYEEDCEKCQKTHFNAVTGDDGERDWAVCLGYNVKLAAEKAGVVLSESTQKDEVTQ